MRARLECKAGWSAAEKIDEDEPDRMRRAGLN
jgi:hypothetical protein